MIGTNEIAKALDAWAPELAERFTSLAYLGSDSSINWINDSHWSVLLSKVIHADGHSAATEMWSIALKERKHLSAPALLIILEHVRRHAAATGHELAELRLNFSNTLAYLAFRAADALYEGAKESFAGDEIDTAIARFRAALSEFRFSIESKLLSGNFMRIATGKYATAVAMIGRWVNVPHEVLSRALAYSSDSITLGNQQPEALTYRLELLVLQFDQTGNVELLRSALELLSSSENIKGTELVEAEARFRLSLLADSGSRDARRYLKCARDRLALFHPKSGVEEARRGVLFSLIHMAEQVRLVLSAKSIAIPRGILAQMATEPSTELWKIVRSVINELENLRKNRASIPSAVLNSRFLRQMVDGPNNLINTTDLTDYVEITGWLSERASWNRHVKWEAGAAALSAAKRTGNHVLAERAQQIFEELAVTHTTWPLPLIGIARVQDYLVGTSKDGNSPATDSWRDAATLALNSAVYVRSNLGGRNEVFAFADARGFLSETFIFKPTTKPKAEHEASMLNALRSEILRLGDVSRFEVPRSLAIVEVASAERRQWVHVSQRAVGRLVSDLRAEEVLGVLNPIVDLLAIFHRVAGGPPVGRSAWGPLKNYLKLWAKTLFEPHQADHFVDSLRSVFPTNLPLVRKRDGHASNWLVDPAGRIVAIDFESIEFIPIGYDVAQLIEDNALIPADLDGWLKRLEIMERYLVGIGQSLDNSDKIKAYGWFALTRALRLGTEKEAGKQLKRHARELCGILTEYGDDAIKTPARELFQALSRIELTDTKESVPSHDHRRLSKSMAYQLRHKGPSNGISVDQAGFASMDTLASVLNVDSSHLLAVAEHPGEPRFEVRDDRIRALYGHSLDVMVDTGINVGAPTSLYHGSSWSALNTIIRHGLVPMQRHMVHLTNIAEEAMAVGERKGAPILLVIEQSHNEEPVAEGIWVAQAISPQRLSILNPFIQEAGVAR